MKVETKLYGNIRRDHFGRFVVDPCPSDRDHIRDAVAKPGDDRARCRNLVEESLFAFEGKRGTLHVTIELEEDVQAQST
jgi:hypothetical protein